MIYGIGTDLVEMKRISTAYQRYGQRFVSRILTPAEYDFFESQGSPVAYLAKRFAMKEAVSKALGTGIGERLGFQDIEIVRERGNRPEVSVFKDEFEKITLHITVSDEHHSVVAFAVAEQTK